MPHSPRAGPARPPIALARARLPPPVGDVLRVLDRAGHRSWLVGGAVRDMILGRERAAGDLDVATPARPEQVMALFPKVVPTGIEHGTVTVLSRGMPVEVTTFRGEGAYVDGRRPSSVTFLDDIDEDLARRDFTVNALAWDPIGKAFRDPFGGRRDLRRRILRAVGDPAARFTEDGLRPLRAARFAAQLGFEVDGPTLAAIPAALAVTARVSAERKKEELSRMLVACEVRRGLLLLDTTGLLGVILPDLAALEPALREHAFQVTRAIARDLTLRLASLLHVLAASEPAGAAARRVRVILEALRFSGEVRDGTAALIAEHGCLLAHGRAAPPETDAGVRQWLSQVGRARATSVLALWAADAAATRPPSRARREREAWRDFSRHVRLVERTRPPLDPSDLALDGRAVMEILGVPGGPVVGEALRHLLGRVLADPDLNTRHRLTSELRDWQTSRVSPN